MEYQLKQSGAVVDNKDFNDLGSFSPKLAKLKMFFQDLDSQQFCNRYKWTGFPKYMYNTAIRFAVQVAMPNWLRGWVFQKFARS